MGIPYCKSFSIRMLSNQSRKVNRELHGEWKIVGIRTGNQAIRVRERIGYY
jgi:hypothetical protein